MWMAVFHLSLGLIQILLNSKIYIKLIKVLDILEFHDKFRDQQKQILILDYDSIEILIILHQIKRAIFFLDKEDQYSYRRL